MVELSDFSGVGMAQPHEIGALFENAHIKNNIWMSSGGISNASRSDLVKALEVGYDAPEQHFGDPDTNSLQPLIPPQLDGELYNQTYGDEHLTLFPRLARDGTKNTIVQYNQLVSYGSNGNFAWVPDGGRPPSDAARYARQKGDVKFMGTTRELPLSASFVERMGEAKSNVDAENQNGVMSLLKQVEQALFEGDSHYNPYQIDGLYAQINRAQGTILDARGKSANVDDLKQLMAHVSGQGPVNEATGLARENYGTITDVYSPNAIHADWSTIYNDRTRKAPGAEVDPNFVFKQAEFDHGTVKFNRCPLLNDGEKRVIPGGQGDYAKRPRTPLITTQPTAMASGAAVSKFVNADAGAYTYAYVLTNAYGWSEPVYSNAVLVAADDKVEAVLRDPAYGTPQAATGLIVYRTEADQNGQTYAREMVRVPMTGAVMTFTDLNDDIPNTHKVYLLSMKRNEIKWRSLFGTITIPLAQVDGFTRWMIMMSGMLQISAPRHHAVIKNVKADTTSYDGRGLNLVYG